MRNMNRNQKTTTEKFLWPIVLALATVLELAGCVIVDKLQRDALHSETISAITTPEPILQPPPESTPEPTPSPMPKPTPLPTPEPQSHRIAVQVTRNGSVLDNTLTDNIWYTSVLFEADDNLVISSSDGELISALYILWAKRPLPFCIVYPDGSVQNVEGNMLHQVVRLDKPCSSVQAAAAFAGSRLELGDIFAYSTGSLPDDVQDWQKMEPGEADICLFPAHADDEYVYFGGILPYYAGELGCKVQVCWMTNHDNDYCRNHELLNALWRSGCRYYPEINNSSDDIRCWGYEAGAQTFGFETFESYQVEMIRKYRPFVVVGHDENGESGHGAHCLSSKTLEQAVIDAADKSKFFESSEQYGVWDTPKCYIHLYGTDPTVLDDSIRLESFGGHSIHEAALECFKQHTSQYLMREYTVYSAGHPHDSRLFGLQRTLVGEDDYKNDLLEHIDRSAQKALFLLPMS